MDPRGGVGLSVKMVIGLLDQGVVIIKSRKPFSVSMDLIYCFP